MNDDNFYLKKWKNSPENVSTSIFKKNFPCLYNFSFPKYRWDLDLVTDPVKIFRTGSFPKGPDLDSGMQPCLPVVYGLVGAIGRYTVRYLIKRNGTVTHDMSITRLGIGTGTVP